VSLHKPQNTFIFLLEGLNRSNRRRTSIKKYGVTQKYGVTHYVPTLC
jgi:hypothetical protein